MFSIGSLPLSLTHTELTDGFLFRTEVAASDGPELLSHLGPTAPGFASDLDGDRMILTEETARDYPSGRLLALQVVSGGLPALCCAELVAQSENGFGATDIDVSADWLAFDFGDIRVDAGDRVEGRLPDILPVMGWPSADAFPKAMAEDGL